MILSYSKKSELTYKYDCIRGAFEGIVFSGLMTFALLIAIREFEAPSWIKSFLSINFGRLITPFFLMLGYKIPINASSLSSIFLFITAIFLFLVPFAYNLWVYAIFISIAYLFFAQPPQMMIQVYSQNYTSKEIGSKVSSVFLLSTAFGAIFSYFGGKILDIKFNNFRFLFFFMSFCALLASLALKKIPSNPLSYINTTNNNFIQNIKIIWKDKLFGLLLIAFILLTLGNSIAMPVKIEYLAQKKYGINASNQLIAFLIYGMPAIIIMLTIKIWGFMFDYIKFITARIISNFFLIISFILFFSSINIHYLIFSSFLHGIGLAGHIVMWHLWIIKIAPKDQLANYMTIHTSISGFKGILSPFVGYYLLYITTPLVISYICVTLFIFSCIILLFLSSEKRIR